MSIWQTKTWGEMLKKSNQAEEIYNINGIQVEKRKVSMGEYGLFVLGLDKDISEKDVKELIKLCKNQNSLFIQLETLDYSGNSDFKLIDFKEGYYKKFITPYTAVIDLKQSEDEILAAMKPKGRYNIKVANKNDVVVKELEKTDENIRQYYDLMIQTTSRDGFSGNSFDYYKTFLLSLENSKLLLAYKDEEVIAGGIFTFDEEVSIYYYGASTSDKKYRNMMAPYLLQFSAIKIAKDIGSKIYDFLGVASPGEKNSALAGVTDFKMKLSKDVREVSFSYIFINKKFKYCIIQILRRLKRK